MEKQQETKALYDQLVAQLKEEGGMLAKRDKERFKQAMKDLKDYEIYKQVMEAAMVRMQAELEAYAKENQELKQAKGTEERSAAKYKTAVDKANKDLIALTKKVQDLQPKLTYEEKRVSEVNLVRCGDEHTDN